MYVYTTKQYVLMVFSWSRFLPFYVVITGKVLITLFRFSVYTQKQDEKLTRKHLKGTVYIINTKRRVILV